METDEQVKIRQERRRRVVRYGGLGSGVVAIMALVYFFFFAAVVYHSVDEALGAISEEHPSAIVRRDRSSGYAATISKLEATTGTETGPVDAGSAGRAAVAFIERPEVSAAIGVPKAARLSVTGTYDDPQRSGYKVVRIQQFVDQVRLFGGEIAVSLLNGPTARISSLSIRPATVPALDMQPAIDEDTARRTAAERYAAAARDPRSRLPEPPPAEVEKVVFDPTRFGLKGEAALAWRVRLASLQVFVNAKTGQIITAYDNRHTALNRRTHDCSPALSCKVVLDETGALIATPPVQEAVRAHDAAAIVHGYFRKIFGRDGFDDVLATGGKAPIESFVNISNLDNAQWNPELLRLEYGTGWTTLDIAAHEYTHAVTQFGPKLEYLGQTGAVNEFFSDFFAAMIEKLTNGNSDWQIGEAVPGFSVKRPLRDMARPNNGGFNPDADFDPDKNAGQPDHFTKLVTEEHKICASLLFADNGCVHFNSGILNKAMTLAIDGHTFEGKAVPPIPRAKVEQIMFRTLVLGGVITSSSNITDTANGAVVACGQLLTSKFAIDEGTCASLALAFKAVGITMN
jgi:Zn-dependent metalloprotease